MNRKPLTRAQKVVLSAAFVPMLATGVAGGFGTFSNISGAYGKGTALGAVAAGEGATAVLALVLLGLTMLGQSSPRVVRAGLWALPAAASVMASMAAPDPGRMVIYALTPMGMSISAEGMAFLARRIVVHLDGRDAEAEHKAATVVQALAYHRARAANHPWGWVRKTSERKSWRLARQVGTGDTALGERLLDVQRVRVTSSADAALAEMFCVPVTPAPAPVTPLVTPAPAPITPAVTPGVTPPALPAPAPGEAPAELEPVTEGRDGEDTQASPTPPAAEPPAEEPVTAPAEEPVTAPEEEAETADEDEEVSEPVKRAVTLEEVAAVTGVTTPQPGEPLTDTQLIVVLRHLRYSVDPPMSYRQAAGAFREAGYVGGEQRVRTAWGVLMSHEENAS